MGKRQLIFKSASGTVLLLSFLANRDDEDEYPNMYERPNTSPTEDYPDRGPRRQNLVGLQHCSYRGVLLGREVHIWMSSGRVSPYTSIPKWKILDIVTAVQALIVPEEIPSILSVVYSNIPPINTGIDSRIGLGFRLGPHADFQLLFDIGPQINTEKLNDESKRRRQTVQYVDTSSIKSSDENKQTNSPGSSWLSRWRSSLLASRNKAMVPVMVEESPVPSESGDPTKSGENFVSHLRKLYNKASN